MATRKYRYDPNEIKKIFKENKGPEANTKLEIYVKTGHPGKNEEFLRLALKAARKVAEDRGWAKKAHNSRITISGWSETKRALFIRLQKEGYTPQQFAEHPEFADYYKKCVSHPRHTTNNILGALGYRARDHKADTSKGVTVKKSKELLILEKCLGKARFLTIKIARQWFDKLGRRASLHDILSKFVDNGELVRIPGGEPNRDIYFSARERFYEPRELYDLFAKLGLDSETGRILALVETATKEPIGIERLAEDLYRGAQAKEFLKTFLRFYIDIGLIKVSDGRYQPADIVAIAGFDAQTVKTLEALEANALHREKPQHLPSSMGELQRMVEEGRAQRAVPPIKLPRTQKSTSVSMTLAAELMIGNQFTDTELLNQFLTHARKHAYHFDMVYASGLVAGTFTGTQQVQKQRVILDNMRTVEVQYRGAALTMQALEELADNLYVELGDDDTQLARDYAEAQQAIQGKVWRFGAKKNWFDEAARRRWQREFIDKFKIQSRIIAPYQYRIGRSLLNAEEVFTLIGRKKTEYWLIVEILAAVKNGFPYPEDYKKVVNVDALLGDKANKRTVTPDAIRLDIGNSQEIWFDHNTYHFSTVTQYQNVIDRPEQVVRALSASGEKTPFMLVGAHQETFWATRLPGPNGTWLMQLPGLQDTRMSVRKELQKFHDGIQYAKHWRQHGFRGMPSTPAICYPEILDDGRIRFRIWNRRIAKVIEDHKGKPEQTATVFSLNDTQIGSITQWPEAAIFALDYALYECKADTLICNGDIIHGHNYAQFPQESNPLRLVGVGQQKDFAIKAFAPLIVKAPCLCGVYACDGNHEWNTIGDKIAGAHHVNFLTHYLNGYMDGARRDGKEISLKVARTEYRTRWPETSNPESDKVYAPFHLGRYAGYTVVASHLYSIKGQVRTGNSTPIFQMINWIRGFGGASANVDMLIGGHFHSPHMAQVAGKLLVHIPASASQSGFEWHLGLQAQVGFMLIRFSTRLGIEIEYIPWQFLFNHYKLQSPAYKGKDDDLRRPKPGSREYRHGMQSPFIEWVTDEVNRYVTIGEDPYPEYER